MKRIVVIVLLLAAIVVARVLAPKHRRHAAPKDQPAPAVSPVNSADQSTPAPPTQYAEGDVIVFKSDADSAPLLRVNEGVAGAGNVLIATRKSGSGTWVVVLSVGMDRYVTLDQDLRADDIAGLKEAGFQDPPSPIAQAMSIFRSLTKTEMKYSAERRDRIVVLLCPKADWPKLQLHWPK